MMNHQACDRRSYSVIFVLLFLAVTLAGPVAGAVGNSDSHLKAPVRDLEEPPEAAMHEKPLLPATRYSGRTPIDLKHGLKFNNGTYGLPNAEYEEWAKAPVAQPNVSEKSYPYARQEAFVRGLRESGEFVSTALFNWDYSINHPTEVTKPEVIEYAKASIQTMKPLLEKFDKAVDEAKGSNKENWETAQTNGRRALDELRGAYSQLHHNTK